MAAWIPSLPLYLLPTPKAQWFLQKALSTVFHYDQKPPPTQVVSGNFNESVSSPVPHGGAHMAELNSRSQLLSDQPTAGVRPGCCQQLELVALRPQGKKTSFLALQFGHQPCGRSHWTLGLYLFAVGGQSPPHSWRTLFFPASRWLCQHTGLLGMRWHNKGQPQLQSHHHHHGPVVGSTFTITREWSSHC